MNAKDIADDVQKNYNVPDDYRLLVEERINALLKSIEKIKKESIEIKKKSFYGSLVPYVEKYGKKMIRQFYDYWSEPNIAKTKIRWQLEKTWELELRLKRWADNQKVGQAGHDILPEELKKKKADDFMSRI